MRALVIWKSLWMYLCFNSIQAYKSGPKWTQWFNTDTNQADDGDDETLNSIRKLGYNICNGETPVDAICRMSDGSEFTETTAHNVPNHLRIPCTQFGLLCFNRDQSAGWFKEPTCRDYEVKFLCSDSGDDFDTDAYTGDNISVIAVAAGLSIIVPILCVIVMHVLRAIKNRRDSRRTPLSPSNESEDTESVAIQTDYSDAPPSYHQLFGGSTEVLIRQQSSSTENRGIVNNGMSVSSDSINYDSETGRRHNSDVTDGGEVFQISTGQITDNQETLVQSRALSHSFPNHLNTESSNGRRPPGMHLSLFDLMHDYGDQTSVPHMQTPPPSYTDAIVILKSQGHLPPKTP